MTLTEILSSAKSETAASPAASTVPGIEGEVVRLYDEHAGGMLRYAIVCGASVDLAQDAVQESFFRFFLERSAGHAVSRPKAWLFGRIRTYVLARLEDSKPTDEPTQVRRPPESSRDPEALYLRAEMEVLLSKLLSPRELECVHLRAEGLRYIEIAAVLKIASGTVGALLTRAFKKLRAADVGSEDA